MEFAEIVVETERLDFPALAAGEGPVVVCWHGFPDHPATFGPFAEHLVAAGRRVVAPFLRGHHPSTAAAMRYADSITLAADAAAVAETLGDGGPVDMVGHDIGAGVVHRVAAAWPDRLRRGVTMAVPPPATLRRDARRSRAAAAAVLPVPLPGPRPRGGRTGHQPRPGRLPVGDVVAGPGPGCARAAVHRLYGDPALAANALKIYRGNFDTSLHDPALSGLAPTTEAPATLPLLVLAGARRRLHPAGALRGRVARPRPGLAGGDRGGRGPFHAPGPPGRAGAADPGLAQ